MNDDQEVGDDQAVRRLLAAARHDKPMPAEVGDRMDAVIAGLAAERGTGPEAVTGPGRDTGSATGPGRDTGSATGPGRDTGSATGRATGHEAGPATGRATGHEGAGQTSTGTVVPLRRHRLSRALLAAAAIAAIGLGVTQLAPDADPERATSSTEAGDAATSDRAGDGAGSEAPSLQDAVPEGFDAGEPGLVPSAGAREESGRDGSGLTDATGKVVPRLRGVDAESLRRLRALSSTEASQSLSFQANALAPGRALGSLLQPDGGVYAGALPGASSTGCGPVFRAPDTELVSAMLGSVPVLVAYTTLPDGSQRADVYSCTGPDPRRPDESITLPPAG